MRSHDMSFFLASFFLASLAKSKAACFLDAIAESALKDLVNLEKGESYPIGLWIVADYSAAHLTSRVVQIMIQEKLGYKVALKGPGGLSQDALFALSGCTTPKDANDRGCGSATTYAHVSVEVLTAGYLDALKWIQEQYPQMAPKNLGNIGYDGESELFVPSAVQSKAYEAEGINLDFYRDYNVSWHMPGRYFTNPDYLDVSTLLPCISTSLMTPETMKTYLDLTGDLEGVEIRESSAAGAVGAAGASVIGRCFDNYFWYSPACRTEASACVSCLTGGTGWAVHEIMGKATAHNMPVAIAVASSFQNYANVPKSLDLMLYWWVPDPTFLRLKPVQITFPRYDPDGIAKGDLSSAATAVSIDKYVSQDLSLLAPDVVELLDRLTLTLKNLDEMMLDQLDSTKTSFEVACRWLQGNHDKWMTWLSEKGKCNPQFGIYDETKGQFLEKRADLTELTGITCRACPSGYFSSQLNDGGTTFICKECPRGSFQASGASVACDPCPRGTYQNETSSSSCTRCPLGHYQDEEGSTECNVCPAGASTPLLGSLSLSDCFCRAGSIDIGDDTLNCIPCGEGMHCPFSSSLATLQSGKAMLGPEFVPTVAEGYFTTVQKPLDVFRCRFVDLCPGGTPGTCAGGLKGEPCAVCPAGRFWSSKTCADCGSTALAWLAAAVAALMALYGAYFLVNLEVSAQATPFKTICTLSGPQL